MSRSCHGSIGRKLSYVRARDGGSCNSRLDLETFDERLELDIGEDRYFAARAGSAASGQPGESRSDDYYSEDRVGASCRGRSEANPASELFR